MNACCDEVLLGFGHGFLKFTEQIISGVKELRINHFPRLGISVSRIHIVDHDIEDSDGNFALLGNNEYVVYIFGNEMVRRTCNSEKYEDIINSLRIVVEENRQMLPAAK